MAIDDLLINTKNNVKNYFFTAANKAADIYNSLYERFPLITNYLSTAVGVVGGDAIANYFSQTSNYSFRDLLFTASATVGYSYLAPRMIDLSTNITNYFANKLFSTLADNEVKHNVFNSALLTALYFPVNMLYWNFLTIKNNSIPTLESNKAGALSILVANIPYLFAEYFAIKKFSKPDTVKWLRPFYSAVELAWNTFVAGTNYLVRRS